ncbi:MAG: helix-turn-helix transcriptional regulator [Lachnospiraceae bacterium]|nr:helix-turn-helix transcriptional regulator [Lachnospiraceae bacterium]
MDQKQIGSFLKELRKEKSITQEQLAEHLNVSGRTVSRWETGSNMPDISLLVELSEFYDVSIPEIINGERKSENMNEEVKEVAKSMSEYALAEKESMLKEIRVLSLLGLVALIIYYVIDLSGMGEGNDFFANVAMYSQTLVYVVILLIPFQATGLLNKIRRNDKNTGIPKTFLCIASIVVAFVVAVLIKLILK